LIMLCRCLICKRMRQTTFTKLCNLQERQFQFRDWRQSQPTGCHKLKAILGMWSYWLASSTHHLRKMLTILRKTISIWSCRKTGHPRCILGHSTSP
jgi:hypothetical protein